MKKYLLCMVLAALAAAAGIYSQNGVPPGAYSPGGAGGGAAATLQATVVSSINNLGITGPLFIGLPTAGSGTTWADLSSAGNNITFGGCGSGSPTWVTPIGLNFVRSSAQCLKAPAALNAANTIIIFSTNVGLVNTSGGQFEAPIIGNGNGTAAGANGIELNGIGFGNASYTPSSFCNSVQEETNAAAVPYGSPVMLSFVNASPDTFYTNENAVGIITNANCTPQSLAGQVYQFGGAAAGSGFALNTYYDGTIYAVAMFSGVATAKQIVAIYKIFSDYLNKSGILVNGQTSSSGNTLILVGDSQTYTPGGLYAFYQPTINGMVNESVMAIPGNWSQAELLNNPYMVAPAIPFKGNGGLCVIHNWLGTVDFVSHAGTAATVWSNLQSILRQESAGACKVIAVDVVSSTGFDATIQAYDTTMRAQWRSTGAAYFSDLASVPALGASGASTSNPCFTDGVHQTQGCMENIDTPLMQNAISSIYGNSDSSSATIYASAATAAVATTAGSETGNTITITMTATPANCQVGNFAHVAGTTPAGYSTSNSISSMGWQILTRSPTQVTFFDDTTGLGVITIQGTLVCPQQQPKDNYAIVNFGVGNFTLMSCQGWTGQTKTIQNINAVASTLVPDGAEGLTGIGATSTTLAANSTAVIQSVLVSASAAGCNLVRLQ